MLKIPISLAICLLLGHSLFSQCFTDRHSTLAVDHWISCETQESPNPQRDNSHWVLYDFGDIYSIGHSTIWNCNVFDRTEAGIKTLAFDYSADGETWYEFGTYELEQAQASTFYEGQAGPNFGEKGIRYLLLTSLEQYGDNCACLSEVRFQTNGITTGTDDLPSLALESEILPNPADQQVTLNINNEEVGFESQISILDIQGKVLKEFPQYIVTGESSHEINTNDLESGNYFIKVQSGSAYHTKKLIVIHDQK